jgi:hypothetical protein
LMCSFPMAVSTDKLALLHFCEHKCFAASGNEAIQVTDLLTTNVIEVHDVVGV